MSAPRLLEPKRPCKRLLKPLITRRSRVRIPPPLLPARDTRKRRRARPPKPLHPEGPRAFRGRTGGTGVGPTRAPPSCASLLAMATRFDAISDPHRKLIAGEPRFFVGP